MKNLFAIGLVSTTASIAIISTQTSAQALGFMGSFDWETKPPATPMFSGMATFMIDDKEDPISTGMITFMLSTGPTFKYDITQFLFGDNWELKSLNFGDEINPNRGSIDFMMSMGTFTGVIGPDVVQFNVTNLKTKHVPEPTSTLSLLALGTLGASSTLKRKLSAIAFVGRSPS